MAKPKKTGGSKPGVRAKANGNGNGNGHSKAKTTKAKVAKPKKTAEALSDEQRMTLTFNHLGKLKPLLDAEAAAKAAVKKAYDLAAKDGGPKKDLKTALTFETDEGNDSATAEVERLIRIARWSGAKLGTQMDMFGKPEGKIDPVFEEGKRAAMKDEPRKPPAHHHEKAAQRWLAGFDEGRTATNAARAQGFKPLSETVADVAAQAGMAALGTEQPTHAQAH